MSPPPWVARPPVIVTPTIFTFVLASIVKTLKSGVPVALLRATVRLAVPGPSMSVKPVELLRSGRAVLSVIVPVTEKLIVLLPAVWSACVMQ
jgi:hypothetical protein